MFDISCQEWAGITAGHARSMCLHAMSLASRSGGARRDHSHRTPSGLESLSHNMSPSTKLSFFIRSPKVMEIKRCIHLVLQEGLHLSSQSIVFRFHFTAVKIINFQNMTIWEFIFWIIQSWSPWTTYALIGGHQFLHDLFMTSSRHTQLHLTATWRRSWPIGSRPWRSRTFIQVSSTNHMLFVQICFQDMEVQLVSSGDDPDGEATLHSSKRNTSN